MVGSGAGVADLPARWPLIGVDKPLDQCCLTRVTLRSQLPYIGFGSRKQTRPNALSVPVCAICSGAAGKSPS
jgi:hypothetical protein